MTQIITTEVLVVGGGTGGTAAAIQSALGGAKTILVSEFSWLGGMLTSAGVAAVDGHELTPWQTGIWGKFLQALQARQLEGLDHGWVSMFTYDPRVGAEIFADWVRELPNLQWISGAIPQAVLREDNRITGVQFPEFTIQAKITIDGTELGDLLPLGKIPHRWGWELQAEFQEPSAPVTLEPWMEAYPIQAPTWVVLMQDFGEVIAPAIPPLVNPRLEEDFNKFTKAWEQHGAEAFLNYGRLPGGLIMINWPIAGNDYGENPDRLIASPQQRREFEQECFEHSYHFARFIQQRLGRRYGLAQGIFPQPQPLDAQLLKAQSLVDGLMKEEYSRVGLVEVEDREDRSAFALHPYYRESRRLKGLVTLTEQDILPMIGGQVARFSTDGIAIANYANDHHYPDHKLPLQPKSRYWGGRWTGTPFMIPYGVLIPETVDGFLVCEKNISVSHIANGATRLQPAVLLIGQAAGMAAALCIKKGIMPRDLPIRELQSALLGAEHSATIAPSAIVPLYNLSPDHPHWQHWQNHYLDRPETYPADGEVPNLEPIIPIIPQGNPRNPSNQTILQGIFHRQGSQHYTITLSGSFNSGDSVDRLDRLDSRDRINNAHLQGNDTKYGKNQYGENQETIWGLITLNPEVNQQLLAYPDGKPMKICGRLNPSGKWLVIEVILSENPVNPPES